MTVVAVALAALVVAAPVDDGAVGAAGEGVVDTEPTAEHVNEHGDEHVDEDGADDVRGKGDPAAGILAPDSAKIPTGNERRYAVVIGHNRGAPGETPLRFAIRDATRVRDALVAVAGFAAGDIDLVVDEDAAAVRRRLIAMNERVRVERSAGQASVLVVFSSGHADSEALHLGDTRLPFDELEGLVRGSAADFRLLAVDACKSGELTAPKGLRLTPHPVSLVPTEPSASGYVVLAAGAAGEDAHESERLMGSFFTHHFVSALLGAADDDGDGRVTLSEVYAYTFQETVKSSAQTLAGAQHPSYRYDVRGQGELVLSRAEARRGQGGLVVPVDHGALVVDVTGAVVAELGARGARRLTLVPGRYHLLVRGPRAFYEGDVDVVVGSDAVVDLGRLQKSEYARLVRKGESDAAVQLTPRALVINHTPWLLDAFGVDGQCPGASVGLAVETQHVTVLPRASLCRATWKNAFLRATDTEVAVDVGVLHAFDLPVVSLAVGAAVGAMVLHQEFTTSGVAPPSTSLHPTLSVLGELDVPLPWGFGVVVDAEVRSSIMAVRGSDKPETPLVGVLGAGLRYGF